MNTTISKGYEPSTEAKKLFIQFAQSFNLYTLENLPKILFETQTIGENFSVNYTEKIKSANIELPNELLKEFNPVLLFEVRTQFENGTNKVELVYIEHTYTAFCTPLGNIAILRHDYKSKKYFFMPIYGHYRKVQNVSHHIREKIKKDSGLIEPKNIGVFNYKKVLEWLEWCDKKVELNNLIVESNKDKNAKIEEHIQDFIDRSKGIKHKWHDNTEVETPLFIVTFEHNKSEQYLNTKIRFKGNLEDIIKISNKEA